MSNYQPSTKNELDEASQHLTRLNRLAYFGILIALVSISTYLINFKGPLSSNPEHWGQFGDFLGGVLNPTFSFLALLALLATFSLQVKELRLSSKELKNSADALIKQNQTLEKQNFETSFFQLLKLHNDIILSIDLVSDKKTTKGRDCFKIFLKRLEHELNKQNKTTEYKTTYALYFITHEHELGHYFRLLYNIIKLINNTENIDKKFYTNIVRAQLSSAELMLLFYNCLSEYGIEKFKPLVEKFSLLKTIPRTTLPPESLIHQYTPIAFGGRYPVAAL
ncbi:putative phage abortive infection protein [Pseudomonas sp. 22526]|uniref:putative phage abortive infection protein n=1 Tax=Pseudomonas sp. 22526 TaxID=3453937 RepID=UPI003F871DA2